jgi:hypothetical protein
MAKRLPYKQGDWFSVPLRTTGYAVGCITRIAPRGKLLVGYFFGPVRDRVPSPRELAALSPNDAVLICRFSDLAFLGSEWTLIGRPDPDSAGEWVMPEFERRDAITGGMRLIRYRDDDPRIEIEAIAATKGDARGVALDGAWGSGAVGEKLTTALRAESPPGRWTLHLASTRQQ